MRWERASEYYRTCKRCQIGYYSCGKASKICLSCQLKQYLETQKKSFPLQEFKKFKLIFIVEHKGKGTTD